MSEIVLSVVHDPANKRIIGTLKNIGKTTLKIGNLTLTNLKFGPSNTTGLPVVAWISTHLPNSDGLRTLDPMASVEYEYDYLREFQFPAAGTYSFWLIYDSLGFKDRFAGADGPHTGLDSLDEIRCKSDQKEVTVSESDYDYNRKYLRSLAM